ncbi:G8 domain-containing protein [Bythopirellula polymerisocia]|uniref:G8 domain protein n=1 Tax=Bythopirellula polymerisocia TaxID=2528003 RepID=A0A5C6CXB6_9BACT|nr:G8 domain-containing protein [Bythopirellula polymerisocia]TWU28101.1 G8 domain protein [Bythopirellula polymerisocia]
MSIFPFGKHRSSNKSRNKGLRFESLEERVVLSTTYLTVDEPTPAIAAVVSTITTPIEDWVHSLTFERFAQLTPEQVIYLLPEQLATIPNHGSFYVWSAESRAALTINQVRALPVDRLSTGLLTNQQVTWLTQPQVQSLNISTEVIRLLSPTQLGWLTTGQIQSLKYWDLSYIYPAQIPQVSTAQIASIPSVEILKSWSSAVRGALTVQQVRSLRVDLIGINLLNSSQIGWLTASQIQSLNTAQLPFLQPGQIQWLTTSQFSQIDSHGTFSQWSPALRAALNLAQVRSLRVDLLGTSLLTDQQVTWLTQPQVQSLNMSTEVIRRLAPTQLGWLTTGQIQTLKYWDLSYLYPSQIPQVSTAQIASIPSVEILKSWSSAARDALTSPQVRALRVDLIGIGLLNSTQIVWLSAAQLQSLKIPQLPLLQPAQIQWLTTSQISQIDSHGTFSQWSPALRAALNLAQVRSLPVNLLGTSLLTDQQVTWLTQPQVQSLNMGTEVIRRLSPTQLGWLTSGQIQSLKYWDLSYLYPAQIPQVSTAQIASIPSVEILKSWSSAARDALTSPQVRALRVDLIGIGLLNSTQIGWLTASQIQSLNISQLPFLQAFQILILTSNQLAQIDSHGAFSQWSPAQRASLIYNQVRSLRVDLLSTGLLTDQQVTELSQTQVQSLIIATEVIRRLSTTQLEWLTVSQIQSLKYWDFLYLDPSQIPLLTLQQVASIPSRQNFAALSPSARAALTIPQVRALDVAKVNIDLLNPGQIQFLTVSQIQSLKSIDFVHLSITQLKLVTSAQFAAVSNPLHVTLLDPEVKETLSREQILSMPLDIYAEFVGIPINLGGIENYVPVSEYAKAADGLASDPRTMMEWMGILSLVPDSSATHFSVASGRWSNPATWLNGQVPSAGAKVVVASGTDVYFDATMNSSLATLRIDGTLRFAHNQNTLLWVDTIVVDTSGTLLIGTQAQPIQSGVTARIVFPTETPIDMTWDPRLLSRGIVSRGTVRMYGEEVTPYVGLVNDPSKGDSILRLESVPTHWRVGDQLVLTGTNPYTDDFGTEERTILAINGSQVTVAPLDYDHHTPAGHDLSVYVANRSRNITLASSDPDADFTVRPHIMFVHNPDIELVNIGVYGFGRTNKLIPIGTPINGGTQPGTLINARGRYAIHFHRTGVDAASDPAIVRGSVVDGSPGWGFVNHQSYVLMDDNVAYQVRGASFATEDGNEIGHFIRNLSIASAGSNEAARSRMDIHDFGHAGNGFWLQGPLVEVVDNIVAGASSDAYVIFSNSSQVLFSAADLEDPNLAGGQSRVAVSALPLKRFEGNVAFASRGGVETWYINRNMTDRKSNIEDFTAWNVANPGVFLEYTGRIDVNDVVLLGMNIPDSPAILSNVHSHDITYDNVHIENFDVGIQVDGRGKITIQNGFFKARVALDILEKASPYRTVEILGNPVFASLTTAQLGGRTQYDYYLSNESRFPYQYEEDLVSHSTVYVNTQQLPSAELYSYLQISNAIPFPSSISYGYVRDEWLDLTNQQLWQQFGVAYGGAIAPADSVIVPRIYGLVYQP